jgi:glucose 1-dehydrogenase
VAENICKAQRLAGQRAIVTGASSGIGKAIAIALASEGADVLVNYLSGAEEAQAVVAAIESIGRRAIPFQADVSREGDVERMFDVMLESLGGLDILVANAGLQKDARFEDMTVEDWHLVLGTNLTGQFLCARAAVREFKRRGVVPQISASAGKIIFMSSVHEIIPWARHVNYAASKGGVMSMMRSVAQEVAPARIRVNSIAPGAIRTPINEDAWGTPAAMEDLLRLIPYGRIGESEDVARAAVWLASDDSDYVTGTTLFVDGGMTLYPGFEKGG